MFQYEKSVVFSEILWFFKANGSKFLDIGFELIEVTQKSSKMYRLFKMYLQLRSFAAHTDRMITDIIVMWSITIKIFKTYLNYVV